MQIGLIEDRRQKVHQSNVALCGSLQFYEDWLQSFTKPENYQVMLKQSQADFARSAEERVKLEAACMGKIPREDLDNSLEEARKLRETLRVRRQDVENFQMVTEKTHKTCEYLQ